MCFWVWLHLWLPTFDALELICRSQAETSYKYRIHRYEETLGTDDPPAEKKLTYQGILLPPNLASIPTPVGSRKVRLALVPHPLGLIASGMHVPRSAPFRTCKRLWRQRICRRHYLPPFHSSGGQTDASHSPERSMTMTVLAKKKSPR